MLGSYPELLAGGAIIAGLPFASANTLPEALDRMRGQPFPPSRYKLYHRARGAARHGIVPRTRQSGTARMLQSWFPPRPAQ